MVEASCSVACWATRKPFAIDWGTISDVDPAAEISHLLDNTARVPIDPLDHGHAAHSRRNLTMTTRSQAHGFGVRRI